ncbi:MAG: sigma-70 family RNA polymerase sigma factor [Syntrophus sp. (in: bacteria)]
MQSGKNYQISPQQDDTSYQRLIIDNLQFIDKQCRKAIINFSHDKNLHACVPENEAEALANEVIERLSADNFKALREFKGNAKITTYITTVIANIIIDTIRKRKGRSRAKERAKAIGKTGEMLYELIYTKSYSLQAAFDYLKMTYDVKESLDDLRSMVELIRRKEGVISGGDQIARFYTGKPLSTVDDEEIDVADPGKPPDVMLEDKQRESLIRQTLHQVISELTGEEKLILRMRYPVREWEEPKSAGQISNILGISEKSVARKLKVTLVKCREILCRKGFGLDDLTDCY